MRQVRESCRAVGRCFTFFFSSELRGKHYLRKFTFYSIRNTGIEARVYVSAEYVTVAVRLNLEQPVNQAH